MARCASYYDWTDECRRSGCKECGTMEFEGAPPEDCTCKATSTACGYVMVTVAERSESCPHHGRCQCVNGPMYYDDHREVDCWDRKWDKACPLIVHRP